MIFVSRSDLNLFFPFTRKSLPPVSSQLFFRFALQLLVEPVILSFCPLQPRAASFVLNRMALLFIFCLALSFSLHHIPTSD